MTVKMTPEQKEMFDGLTRLQQEVALNSLSGMSDIDSYRNSSGKAKTESAMRAGVSEILSNPNVKAFIDSMMEVAVSNAVMSRQEMLERLSGLARTNMADLVEWRVVSVTDDEGRPVEQSIWSIKESALLDQVKAASISELTAGKDGFKIKQHSPLQAMRMIADMEGYNQPSKVELTHKKADESEW